MKAYVLFFPCKISFKCIYVIESKFKLLRTKSTTSISPDEILMANDLLQSLSSRHLRMMDYLLAGWKIVEIAQEWGYFAIQKYYGYGDIIPI